MSIYRDEESRAAMARWYTRYLERLEEAPEERQVETSHGQTNVLMCGPEDAPALVCLHGAMASAALAMFMMEPLADAVRLVCLDTIGQPGRSAENQPDWRGDVYGEWFWEVMDGLGIERPAIFGASMGGYIAIRAAIVAPERVDRLVLWSPAGITTTSMATGYKLTLPMIAYNMRPSEARARAMCALVYTNPTDDQIQYYQESFGGVKIRHTSPERARPEQLQRLTAPVLLVTQEEDLIFTPPRLIKRARQLFPNLREPLVLAGFKHAPPEDHALLRAPLDAVRRFVLEREADAPIT